MNASHPPAGPRRERSTPRRPAGLRHALLVPALVSLLPWLSACDGGQKKDAQPGPPPPAVVVAEVVQKTVPIVSEFVARTDAVQTVEIKARV